MNNMNNIHILIRKIISDQAFETSRVLHTFHIIIVKIKIEDKEKARVVVK